MFTQKEAVFNVVTSHYGDKFENGMTHTKEAKSAMVDKLIEMYEAGEWEIKNEQQNLRSYVIGLLNNHLRKDTRLNGGEKYTPANPGSRAGQGDPQVKAIRQLLKTLEPESAEYIKAKAVLDERVAAIKAERAKKEVQIDVEALPEELKALVG